MCKLLGYQYSQSHYEMRFQSISEEDAKVEGVEYLFDYIECHSVSGLGGKEPKDHGYKNYLWHGKIGKGITNKQADSWKHQYSNYKTAKDSFSSLWEMIHGPGAWERNEWIWGYEYEVIKK